MDNIQSSIQQPVKHILNGKIEEDKFILKKVFSIANCCDTAENDILYEIM